ncbi:MAG: hypothetical protein RLY31_2590 [Bacteroidota bacterium]|jgi:beta-hydroxylase
MHYLLFSALFFGTLLLFGWLAYRLQPALLTLPFTGLFSMVARNPPFLSLPDQFPGHDLLRQNWKVIRSELEQILQHADAVPTMDQIDPIQRFISARDTIPWRSFIIKAYDQWVPANAARVPRTAALVRQLPQIKTAMFSILEPGKRIPPHIGFYKGVLRYHLGLIVPTDSEPYLVVGGKRYAWREGEDVLFDDTFLHEAVNRSRHRRIVLFCDVLREPHTLPAWADRLNRGMFGLLSRSKRLQHALQRAELPPVAG